jgi:hypothetical protein
MVHPQAFHHGCKTFSWSSCFFVQVQYSGDQREELCFAIQRGESCPVSFLLSPPASKIHLVAWLFSDNFSKRAGIEASAAVIAEVAVNTAFSILKVLDCTHWTARLTEAASACLAFRIQMHHFLSYDSQVIELRFDTTVWASPYCYLEFMG